MSRSHGLALALYLSLSLSSKKQCPFAANDEPNLQPNIENPSTREGTGVESTEKPNIVVKQYRQNKKVISIFSVFFFLAKHANIWWRCLTCTGNETVLLIRLAQTPQHKVAFVVFWAAVENIKIMSRHKAGFCSLRCPLIHYSLHMNRWA